MITPSIEAFSSLFLRSVSLSLNSNVFQCIDICLLYEIKVHTVNSH